MRLPPPTWRLQVQVRLRGYTGFITMHKRRALSGLAPGRAALKFPCSSSSRDLGSNGSHKRLRKGTLLMQLVPQSVSQCLNRKSTHSLPSR